jgi:hypothetical protein
MHPPANPLLHRFFTRVPRSLLAFACALAPSFACGCGVVGSQPPGSEFSGNTTVTVMASSTANDLLSGFGLVFNSFTLTSQSGNTVSLIADPEHAEFIHVNGTAEWLTTVTIPQGVYTSATASIGPSGFTCIDLDSSDGIVVSNFGYGDTPSSNVTVTLPDPITITDPIMGLSLDLLVLKSASYTSCDAGSIEPYSVTPSFGLTPMTLLPQPTNSENGKESGLDGMIASVSAAGNSFTVTAADGPSWQVASIGSTVYQGVAGISNLAVGMPVDMDVVIQPNGSLLATRVAVEDTDTSNLTVSIGPLVSTDEFAQGGDQYITANAYGRGGWGPLLAGGATTYSFGGTTFQISGQFTNLQNLPFPASFTAANMVAGQNVLITTHALTLSPEPIYAPAATITLMPQTINGTVNGVSTDGNFTVYSVTLAGYDLFPELAVQPGQTTLLTAPSSIVVYADSNTQMLNTSPIVVGGVVRFNGLVFNDNGTLRMDCAQVNDGVAE